MLFGFHVLDIVLAILCFYFIVRGCMRGFVGEIITLIGFGCSFYCSFKFSGYIAPFFADLFGINESVSRIASVIVIWLVIALLVAIIRKLLKSLLSLMSLGAVDTLLGIVSGFLKTVVVVYSIIIVGLLLSPIFSPIWMTKSDILRYAGRNWPAVRAQLVNHNIIRAASDLPDGTLEQILRPYRTGAESPVDYTE